MSEMMKNDVARGIAKALTEAADAAEAAGQDEFDRTTVLQAQAQKSLDEFQAAIDAAKAKAPGQ